jgi:MFS family permease
MSARSKQGDTGSTSRSLVRWYPAGWRARYGDEFLAMVADDLGGRRPGIRYRFSIARFGLNERVRGAGLVGDAVPRPEQVRSGALTVLCAFALFVIPGVAFAKISEHWDQSFQRGSHHLPAVSFTLLAGLAGACAVAVALAAVALLPTFVRFLRAGGWTAIRRRVKWAVIATVATATGVAGLAVAAGHLTGHQRNTGFGWYQVAFVIVALLFAATVVTWSMAAVAVTRRLDIGSGQLKVAGSLAVLVGACMPLMTAAAATWWGSMATTAPWFLAGTPTGSSPSPWAVNLLAVLIVMTIGSGAGMFGVLRVIRSMRALAMSLTAGPDGRPLWPSLSRGVRRK